MEKIFYRNLNEVIRTKKYKNLIAVNTIVYKNSHFEAFYERGLSSHSDILDNSFNWDHTEEGRGYWSSCWSKSCVFENFKDRVDESSRETF